MKEDLFKLQEAFRRYVYYRLDKNLHTSKGSRQGNSGNRLELCVLTKLHHVPWINRYIAHFRKQITVKAHVCSKVFEKYNTSLPFGTVKSSSFLKDITRNISFGKLLQPNIFKMVQGEKQATLITIGNSSRSSDPAARKAGYEAVQRMDQAKKDQKNNTNGQYGSWGPVFKNKSNFAEQHWC